MKIQMNLKNWSIPVIVGAASCIALVAWTGNPQLPGGEQSRFQDTIPSNKRNGDARKSTTRDFDKELQQLEDARKQLEEAKNIDFEKMKKDIEESIKKIDFEKIQLEAQAAMQKIDIEKMQKDIQASLKEIDLQKIEKDIQLAMEEVSKIDKEKMRAELEKAKEEIRKIDKEEMRRSLEEIKKIDMTQIAKELEEAKSEMAKAKIELDGEKLNLKKELEKAHVELDKAKASLKLYQEMVYAMEKDGLLDTSKDYTVTHNKGEITVNGKVLDKALTEKYSKYFNQEKEETIIKKRDGSLNIEQN